MERDILVQSTETSFRLSKSSQVCFVMYILFKNEYICLYNRDIHENCNALHVNALIISGGFQTCHAQVMNLAKGHPGFYLGDYKNVGYQEGRTFVNNSSLIYAYINESKQIRVNWMINTNDNSMGTNYFICHAVTLIIACFKNLSLRKNWTLSFS